MPSADDNYFPNPLNIGQSTVGESQPHIVIWEMCSVVLHLQPYETERLNALPNNYPYRRDGFRPYSALDVGPEVAAKVDQRRFARRYPKSSTALRDAIEAGLAAIKAEKAQHDAR